MIGNAFSLTFDFHVSLEIQLDWMPHEPGNPCSTGSRQ